MSSFIRLVKVLHELQPLNRVKFHKINHNYVTNYQYFMKLKLNLYQCNMAIRSFVRMSALEHELVPLNQFNIVRFSRN